MFHLAVRVVVVPFFGCSSSLCRTKWWASIAAVFSPQKTFSAKTPLWRGDKALPGAGIKIVVETLPRCCHDATPQKLAARRGKSAMSESTILPAL